MRRLMLILIIWCAAALGKPPVVAANYVPQAVEKDGTTPSVEDYWENEIIDEIIGAEAQNNISVYRPAIDIVEGIIRPLNQPESTTEEQTSSRKSQSIATYLNAIKVNLKAKLQSIFQPNVQQMQGLNLVIDSTFSKINKQFSEQKRLDSDPNAKACGNQMECTEIWMCRNSTPNAYGAHIIQFQSSYKSEDCNYNQVCCHISDKLLTKPAAKQPFRISICGNRNEIGVQLSIQGTRSNEANFGEFPWMVAILVKNDPLLIYIGGGSLVSKNVVLTAAHKIANRTEETLLVRAGEWDQSTTLEIFNHQDIGVQLRIIHNRFDGHINNIALLYLKDSFISSPHISPICLPSQGQIFDYSRCIVTGWGKSPQNSSFYHHILKKITVPVLPRAMCNSKLRQITYPQFNLHESYICAGGEKDMDSCHGDGGAPLVCPIQGRPNRYVQAGIVAWGIGCGQENVPAAYTNVAHLMPWVAREINRLNSDLYSLD